MALGEREHLADLLVPAPVVAQGLEPPSVQVGEVAIDVTDSTVTQSLGGLSRADMNVDGQTLQVLSIKYADGVCFDNDLHRAAPGIGVVAIGQRAVDE
ncbi:hypothetical protein [Gordonia sp. NPDC058843]|uniref:hypothetical protein n=1 Tax=Gordonia sp. NPDC058843 TaxID=3346648 RepID=UPI0036CB4008